MKKTFYYIYLMTTFTISIISSGCSTQRVTIDNNNVVVVEPKWELLLLKRSQDNEIMLDDIRFYYNQSLDYFREKGIKYSLSTKKSLLINDTLKIHVPMCSRFAGCMIIPYNNEYKIISFNEMGIIYFFNGDKWVMKSNNNASEKP